MREIHHGRTGNRRRHDLPSSIRSTHTPRDASCEELIQNLVQTMIHNKLKELYETGSSQDFLGFLEGECSSIIGVVGVFPELVTDVMIHNALCESPERRRDFDIMRVKWFENRKRDPQWHIRKHLELFDELATFWDSENSHEQSCPLIPLSSSLQPNKGPFKNDYDSFQGHRDFSGDERRPTNDSMRDMRLFYSIDVLHLIIQLILIGEVDRVAQFLEDWEYDSSNNPSPRPSPNPRYWMEHLDIVEKIANDLEFPYDALRKDVEDIRLVMFDKWPFLKQIYIRVVDSHRGSKSGKSRRGTQHPPSYKPADKPHGDPAPPRSRRFKPSPKHTYEAMSNRRGSHGGGCPPLYRPYSAAVEDEEWECYESHGD